MLTTSKFSVCDIILIIILVLLTAILIFSVVYDRKNIDRFLTQQEYDAQLLQIARAFSNINVDKIKYNLYNL
jgi:Na+-transporting NADH:ubiquinone oxidoreductase subunit NqrC